MQPHNGRVSSLPTVRHLLRARDAIDTGYSGEIRMEELARVAGLSRAHFSREFSKAFGESPQSYLLTRRLERAASLLCSTDRSVSDICMLVGLQSVGSFTSSFGRKFGMSPTAYRAAHPAAVLRARVPACVVRAHARPQHSTSGEDG